MPRRARLAVSGIPWHIIQRGNNRCDCFFAEQDYQRYLTILSEQAEQYGCAIHAYVLMPNHVHLLLTPSEKNSAAQMMKHLSQRYVQYINRCYRRSGTLWEGRFRSCLTQNEVYVLTCYRYIELNPVRSNIATHPRDYRWSSFHANGDGKCHDGVSLTPHHEYLRLGYTTRLRLQAYRGLFMSQLHPERVNEIRAATNGNLVLGNRRFQQQIADMLQRRVTPGRRGRPVRENDNS